MRGQTSLHLQNSIFANFRNLTLRNKVFELFKQENEHKSRPDLPTELADPSFSTLLVTGKPFLGSRRSKSEVLASKMLKIVFFQNNPNPNSPYHVKGYILPIWRYHSRLFLCSFMRDLRFSRFPDLKTNIFRVFISGRAQNGRFSHIWP